MTLAVLIVLSAVCALIAAGTVWNDTGSLWMALVAGAVGALIGLAPVLMGVVRA